MTGEHDQILPRDVKTVGIAGSGIIGASWAAYFLSVGMDVIAVDPARDAEAWLSNFIEDAWPTLIKAGIADGASKSRLTFSHDPVALSLADFVQENAPDNIGIKHHVFSELERHVRDEVIIASSTSALLMSDIQSVCRIPSRCVVAHPFSPPHIVPLVEVMAGRRTSSQTLQWTVDFFSHIGKHPVLLTGETSGCIANRLSRAVWREAINIYSEGIAGIAEIDEAMIYGPGMRYACWGPFLIYHAAGGDKGIRGFFEHFGPGMQARWDAMRSPRLTEELIGRVIRDVESYVGTRSFTDLSSERDRCLLAVREAAKMD